MKLKCVAIDDVPYALDLIKYFARQMPEIEPDRLHSRVVILRPGAAQSQPGHVFLCVVETVQSNSDLLQVIGALHSARRPPRGLNCGQQQRY